MNIKERIIFIQCPKCKEHIASYILRHSTDDKLVEQPIRAKYCPVCGEEIN